MAYQYQEQRTDVYAALDYYFEHYNQGRPFILAGHSQGSMILKIALQDYFLEHGEYLERMVAAYVLGYSITTDNLKANPSLRFAEGADDTGVIVSWNIEGPESFPLIDRQYITRRLYETENRKVPFEPSVRVGDGHWFAAGDECDGVGE
jgi:hypothetical protein